ncbi:cytidine deaminase-like fold-containing protein [Yersinia canariae]|uniref:cytidine deaminase-like fold-containing protein n=1 Tax=Yersinia canariae TaxID=2607663 RepID=UPI0040447F5E
MVGKDVCSYCKGDIAAAAQASGAKSVTVAAIGLLIKPRVVNEVCELSMAIPLTQIANIMQQSMVNVSAELQMR